MSAPARTADLWDALTTGERSSLLYCWAGERFQARSWAQVVAQAEGMTAGLRRAGVAPGTRVAAVLTNGHEVVSGILAVWLAGGALASLPVPARGMDVAEYEQQLRRICGPLGSPLLLIEQRMSELLPDRLREDLSVRSWESLVGSGRVEPAPPQADELAFVQYSSGSTSTPKGCMLTPRSILAQIELVWDMLQGRAAVDIGASWLPLSHDMGLFGMLLTPWVYNCELLLSTPERFMLSPRTWFGDLADAGATITAGTNTGLYIGARAYRSARLRRQLRMRVCIVGAERIEWDTLRYATDTLAPYGMREQALMPAYGLAEATLAVTATPLREVPRHALLDAIALADGELREAAPEDPVATRVVSAGLPCRGVELLGVGDSRLQELEVRSPSLAEGYFADEARTRERFADGAVRTGDLGFVRDGHLYPVGRVDDLISIGGRKVYAREIENAVDGLPGVRRGCSMLVERNDRFGGRLTLFVELKGGHEDYDGLASRAAEVAMAKAAVALDECMFLEQGSLPKTPSGKIQRHRCRQMLDADRFRPLARVEL